MRPGARGRDAGCRSVPQDPLRVLGAAGVVHQDGGLCRSPCFQRVQHPTVQSGLTSRWQRAGDRHPAEVVAEGNAPLAAPDESGLMQGAQGRDADAQLREQPVRDRLRRAHQQVEQVAGGVLEVHRPGHDGVPHRRGQVAAVVVEHLGHIERVAGGHGVQAVGVERPAINQGAYGVAAQRRQREGGRIRGPRCVAEQGPQGVRRPDLVEPDGADDDRLGGPDAPQQEAQQVDGSLVGPVQVVHDEDAGSAAQVVEDGPVDLVRLTGALDQRPRRRAQPVGHVEQRPERARRRERIAGAPQHRRLP